MHFVTFLGIVAIQDFELLSSYDELALAVAVAEGPVAAGICGTQKQFLFYDRGIFDDSLCCVDQNHAVLLVGYGTDSSGGCQPIYCSE